VSATETEAAAAKIAPRVGGFAPAPPVALELVEWRVDSPPTDPSLKLSRCRFVPYVNAPIVRRLLDEWVGPFGWEDTYEPATLGGQAGLWCHLTIHGPDRTVTKRDFGVPSNMESGKGLVSDAFKRAACLKWGVAGNVYDLPTLWGPCKVGRNKKGEPIAYFDPERTAADLLKQLIALGYEASGVSGGGGIEAPSNVDPETGEVAEPDLAPAEVVSFITAALNAVEDVDVRKATKQEFVSLFGFPASLSAARADEAMAWIDNAVPAEEAPTDA
jgi:hypothetical protein